MAKESKKSRNKRKAKKSPSWSTFVNNKWDGKEPYEEFTKRETKNWTNLPGRYKSIIRTRTEAKNK